jgi:hypothetical protein
VSSDPGARKPPLDDRLRDAFRAAVDTVQPSTIKSEVLIGAPVRTSSRRHKRFIMFAPLTAAAAVVLAIGTALAIPHLGSAPDRADTTPAASTPAASGAQPPFILIQDVEGPPNPYEVRSAVTGKLIETLDAPPSGQQWLGATAAGTGRTFVLIAGSPSGVQATDTCHWNAYKLRLTTTGTVASLTPLNVPGTPDNGSTSISTPVLSADGSTLAYIATKCSNVVQPHDQDTIVVASHGTIHRYFIAMPTPDNRNTTFIDSLSLSADGSELSYVVDDNTFSYPTTPGGAWVLSTSAPSGPAAQRAHEIFTDNTRHGPWANAFLLSPDGSTGYLLARTGGPYTLGYVLSVYNPRTGALIRTLHTWRNLQFQTGTEAIGGDRALIWGWVPDQATEVNLVTGAAGPYLPRALAKVAVTGVAW